ncbi:hypothetical protein [Nocardia bovistercoris]|uniref:Uncharacterized protein n=1 Tax=Nocardia bovistercoris TaxID=2785916 RepID=A0A931I4H7_9NOCA|nr:hypothetical protein [Nocardia bovistercoris]MBH0774719.1 hypothetical protein [Nocardia bovistercoris]
MSILASVGVSLLTVLSTLVGGWLVSTRIADHWDQIKSRRDGNLAAARDFQVLYGELIATWKTWNNLVGARASAAAALESARWDCLQRATAAEGAIEALVAKLAADRPLTDAQIDQLGALRQAFKIVRRAIGSDKPVPWSSSSSEPYLALKKLSAATSVLLTTPSGTGERPDSARAVRAFLRITDNRHERNWLTTAAALG